MKASAQTWLKMAHDMLAKCPDIANSANTANSPPAIISQSVDDTEIRRNPDGTMTKVDTTDS